MLACLGPGDSAQPPKLITRFALVNEPHLYGSSGPIMGFAVAGGNVLRVTRERGPILQYLAEKLDLRFRLVYKRTYQDIIDALVDEEVDFAWLGPKTYIAARARTKCQPVVQILLNGARDYEGVILVGGDSPARTVLDLEGSRFAYVDEQSTSGFIYPRWYLSTKAIEPTTFFSHVEFAGSHSNCLLRLVSGKYDAVATERGILERHSGDVRSDAVRVLTVTGRIPNGPIAVRAGFSPSLARQAANALVAMAADPQGKKIVEALRERSSFSGFGYVDDDAYREVRKVFSGQGTQ